MAYTVVRVQTSGWSDRFKPAEDDSGFDVGYYPELDSYLSTMEQRGWTVVSTAMGFTGEGLTGKPSLFITMHRTE